MSSTSPPPSPDGRIVRLTRACAARAARRPKTVLALWLAFVVACVAAGSVAGTRTLSQSAANVGPSARAATVLHRAGLTPAASEAILVTSDSARRTAAATSALATGARRLSVVGSVSAPAQTADHGRIELLAVGLRGDPDDADAHVVGLVHFVAQMRTRLPGVRVLETGDASSDNAINHVVSSGLVRAGMIAGPLTLLILALVFGTLAAASLPLLLGLTSVGAAIGALGLVSLIAPEGSSTVAVVTLIGLAVGVDYSLFSVRRWRAERHRGSGPQAALDATAATVGRAIVIAGTTVVIGLAGLLFTGFAIFTSMALGAIVVVAIAVLGSLTVLPAMLALFGDRIDAGRLRLPGRRRHAARAGETWERIAGLVTGHPRSSLAAALVLLVALAVPAMSMHTAVDGPSALSKSVPAVRAADAVAAAFPGASDTETLVVTGHGLGAPDSRRALATLGAQGRALVGGHGAVSVRVSPVGTVAAIDVPVPSATVGQGDRNVRLLRQVLIPRVARVLPGARAQLTGDDAENVDFSAQLTHVTPLVIAFVLGLAFVLLVTAFGSMRLAAAVIGLSLLSVGAAFGVMVLVFQHAWAQSLLHFTSDGAIVNWLPLFAFVVLFGLSMDYTVILLERAAEARRGGLDARTAAARALATTGATLSCAALIMVAVFAVYTVLPMLDFKQMGVGLAAAIALDATLVRVVALPAVLALLGERGLPVRRRPSPARMAPMTSWEHVGHAPALVESGHEG